jgi:polysaccharide pyruvyl transferase CsaB
MPTLLIGGYYGAGNVGDEAILATILHDLRRNDPDLNFIVLSYNPEKTRSEYAVESISWYEIDAVLDAALRSDLIILGGGGIFHDYWGIDPDQYLRRGYWDITAFGSLPLLAKLLSIPCVILAVGVGPLKSELGRAHTRLAFERSQFATVRDPESMEYLLQTGIQLEDLNAPTVSVFADVVFGFKSRPEDELDVEEFLEDNFSIGKDTPLLGVSLRYWESEQPLQERLSLIAQGVKQFLERNPRAHLVTIPFQVLDATPHTDDSIVLSELAKIINIPGRVHPIHTPITPHFAHALIGRCIAVLGMRFHSIVMSINTGTPVVAISYAPKVQSIMKSIGLEEFCNLSLAPEPDELEIQLQAVWEKNLELRSLLLAAGDRLKTNARGHAQTVLNMLEGMEARSPLSFEQEFALKQTRLLNDADQKIAWLEREVQAKSQLITEIESSRFWKLARSYYRLSGKKPFLYLRKLEGIRRQDGWPKALKKLVIVARSWVNGKILQSPLAAVVPSRNIVESEADFEAMLRKISKPSLTGLFIIAETSVAHETYTQRVYNLCRSLSRQGWAVICTGEQVSRDKLPKGIFKNKVFHISIDHFRVRQHAFNLPHSKKILVVGSPHPNLFLPTLELRRQGFDIIYEISNDWEDIQSNGQIFWYDKGIEEAFIINANVATAASRPLLEKFSHLRQDIQLIPDGHDLTLLKMLETPKWKSL